jgi:hypothetical protein
VDDTVAKAIIIPKVRNGRRDADHITAIAPKAPPPRFAALIQPPTLRRSGVGDEFRDPSVDGAALEPHQGISSSC